MSWIDWESETYPSNEDLLMVPVFGLFFPLVRFFLDRFIFERLARRFVPGSAKGASQDEQDECKKRHIKFKESAWKCIYYLSAEIIALAVTYNEPWFTNTGNFWVGPGAQVWPDQKVKTKLKALYMYTAGFYTYGIFALMFWETRRSDFGVSMGHHVATVILIILSYLLRFARVGSIVLALHDASDVFLEVGKMFKYSGSNIVPSISFILFVISWIVLRLIYYPFWILWSTSYEVVHTLDKFIRGTWSTILGSCTVVRDFKDVCYYSYFFAMTDIDNLPPKDGKPLDIKLLWIPGCILVGLLGIIVDVPIITILAFCKAPFMLFKGWQRLLEDLIGRAGPFLEIPCVPFAGLCILLWPLVVTCALLSAIMSSFFLGIYGAAVVYQETSVQRGLAYVIAAIALFDEYSNDLLYMREGSCFPRPKYREESTAVVPPTRPVGPIQKKPPLRVGSFKDTWHDLKSVQVWDNLFQACELYGKRLIQTGAISVYDLQQWKHSDSRILNIGIPACVLLQCFLRSIKDGAMGFLMLNGGELTEANRPEGRVFEWFFEPMTIMKEQLRALQLQESEELYLCQLALTVGDSKGTKTWDNGGIPPTDEIRRAELQALIRRLQGHCTILSRMPTFRRRFEDVVKALIEEAVDMQDSNQSGHIGIHVKT